jgi:hypothetical protein
VTPDVDQANLERLAAALNGLECRLVTDPADTTAWVPLPPDYFTPRSLLTADVYLTATNSNPTPFTWTKAADQIVEKVQRGRVTLDAITKQNADGPLVHGVEVAVKPSVGVARLVDDGRIPEARVSGGAV